MTYLLDTSACSALMKEDPKVINKLQTLPEVDTLVICPIVRGQILFGISILPEGRKRQDLHEKAEKIFASMDCISVSEGASDYYAAVKLKRRKQGLTMEENDLWIAATALALGAVLVTADHDFYKIDGLTIEDWTA